jgi:predicted RNA-binding Zn-ribbon protein involved in translation (DUF1610 family)
VSCSPRAALIASVASGAVEETATFYCPSCGRGRYVTPGVRSVRCRSCKTLTLFFRCRHCGAVGSAHRFGRASCRSCGRRTAIRESSAEGTASFAEWLAATTPGVDPTRGDKLLRNLEVIRSPLLGEMRWAWLAVLGDRLVLGAEGRSAGSGMAEGPRLDVPFDEVDSLLVDGAAAGTSEGIWAPGAPAGAPVGPEEPAEEGPKGPRVHWARIDLDTRRGSLSLRAANLTVGLARAVLEPVRSSLASRGAELRGAQPSETGQAGTRPTAAKHDRAEPAGTDLVVALERLEQLHLDGALDDDEFRLAKRAVIARAGQTPRP